MKTGIFFRLSIAAIVFSLFFFSSCASTSYFEDSKGAAGADTERVLSLQDDEEETQEGSEEKIFVEVQGAVNAPGVFEVEKGTRVFSLISLAGGLSPDADTRDLNQAAAASDGEKIYIRREGEEELSGSSDGASNDGKVNINTADSNTLMALPGIGEAKAKLILDYRQKNGRFQSIEDITKISGIKGGLYEKIKDRITV